MIYGINFRPKQPSDGPTDSMGFPLGFAKKFAKEIRLPITERAASGRRRGSTIGARLVGIADSPQSRDDALIQADNGRRRLHVVERKTAGPTLWGIYTY
jgi:hypothetical protein